MKFLHLIFDLDGTLIDTETATLKTWQETLAEYGFPYSLEKLKCVRGIATESALQRLNAAVDADFEKRWVQNYDVMASEDDFFPEVDEMLQRLKTAGYSLGVVTSRSRDEYNKYFQRFHLDKLLKFIVFADDTVKHKPSPEPLYKYMERIGAEAKQCIYIGDMPTDIECAKNAGVTAGLMQWHHEQAPCVNADYIFTNAEEVLNALL